MRKNSIFSSCKTLLHAFSLVELMISLITISLISAAFAPVITKKLKSSTVTVGAGEVKMECSAFGPNCSLCYEDKCIVCYKSCADNEAVDIANCNCVACSDKHGASCLKCDIKNCSKCTDANYIVNGACTSCEAGYYCDGTTKESCPQGYYCSGGIKTPCPAGTYNDMTGKSTSSDCKNCASNTYSTGSAATCANNTASNCSAKSTTSNTCTSCNAGYGYSSGTCNACSNGTYSAGGTATCASNTATGCSAKSTTSNKCTSCNAGYGYSSGTCTACASGKYSTGGTMACTSVTSVSNCSTYSTTSNACSTCKTNYKLQDNTCIAKEFCSPANGLIKITANLGSGVKTYCITQYNIGDHDNYRLPNPSTVNYLNSIVVAGSGNGYCGACCWRGSTSRTYCDSTNGSYSGCDRTVCNWSAANALCNKITIVGKTGWRLPTQNELSNLNPATYSKRGTSYAGDNGLMFCDPNAAVGYARCASQPICQPAPWDNCNPSSVWTLTPSGSEYMITLYLSNGSWRSGGTYPTIPRSVRCIKEL